MKIPEAPKSIQKGVPIKTLLGSQAVEALAENISSVHPDFDGVRFRRLAIDGLDPLGILGRGQHLARALRSCLPERFEAAVKILLKSLTPALAETEDLGLAVFFYLPHVCFVAAYGLDAGNNGGRDPFESAMAAQHALTQRFSAEFSIRPFLIRHQDRTLARLLEWTRDPSPHVRRLCSEGTRPRLPWATRIPAFVRNPAPVFPILENLKNDPSLYVRRSVANHLGDVAKDHPEKAFALCERWLRGASRDLKWLIRHALRHPAKKGNKTALRLRSAARD